MRIKLFGVCTLMSLGVQCYGQEQDSIKKEEPAVKVQQVILKMERLENIQDQNGMNQLQIFQRIL